MIYFTRSLATTSAADRMPSRSAAHIGQFPDGIGGRYLSEGRLRGEVDRSVGKYKANALPTPGVNGWTNGWEAKAPQPDPELDDDVPEQKPPQPDPELDDDTPEQKPPWEDDPELDDDELDDDELDEDPEPPKHKPACRHSMHTAILIRGRLRAG